MKDTTGDIGGYMDENWHGGSIEGDLFEHPELDVPEEAQAVIEKKSAPAWNWRHAMTRELMRGRHRDEIVSKYADAIRRFGVAEQVAEFLDDNDGVLGWLVVDVSNFDARFGYDDMPEEMRKCNLYAVNATELREIISRSLVSESDGSLDGFLSGGEGVSERTTYVDEVTGLPCLDDSVTEEDMNSDRRLDRIAAVFMARRWFDEGDMEAFNVSDNKIGMLTAAILRHGMDEPEATGEFTDDAGDFGVEEAKVVAEPGRGVKDAEVVGVHEAKVDDIGNTAMPDPVSVQQKRSLSDVIRDDIEYMKKAPGAPKVDPIKRQRLDKISVGEKGGDLNVGPVKRQRLDDIGPVAPQKAQQVLGDPNREADIDEIEISGNGGYARVEDNMSELKGRDYRDDVALDAPGGDFVIDDVSDMRDDEFDYGDVADGGVDLDEMMEDEADRNEAEVNSVPEQVEVSDKYDWSW